MRQWGRRNHEEYLVTIAPDPEVVEAIYEALDRDDPDQAWGLAREALARSETDPVLHYLAGHALAEMDRPAEAAVELQRASELEPGDEEFRLHLAWARFRSCEFEAATAEIQRVKQTQPPVAELHHVRGLCIERSGDLEGADREFLRAAELDSEIFPAPSRFSSQEFEQQLEVARETLDEKFRRQLDQVTILVEDLPSVALLTEESPPLDPEHLLGLFSGVPLSLQDSFSTGGELPPRIHLFKRNLERYTSSAEELAEQIRVTLYHELGHYLGMTEEELEQSGYA